MARDKGQQSNIDNSDLVRWPNGRIRNNNGSGNGTPVNEQVYGDIHEFFAKLMRLAGISYNGLPDNEQFNYQYLRALREYAVRNGFLKTLGSGGGRITINVNLPRVETSEMFIAVAGFDATTETQIRANLFRRNVTTDTNFNVTYIGGKFKTGEYVRVIKKSSGVDLVRLPDGIGFENFLQEYDFLLAATQAEENAGTANNVATTPLTNFTAFANRVIGASSSPFLATQSNNGLMSQADKLKLDTLESAEKNYGTFGPFDVDSGSVGQNYSRTGDVQQAQIVQRTGKGNVVQVTLANAMANTNYQVQLDIESLGDFEQDNDLKTVVWKKISNNQFQCYFEEDAGVLQQIVAHVSVIQR